MTTPDLTTTTGIAAACQSAEGRAAIQAKRREYERDGGTGPLACRGEVGTTGTPACSQQGAPR